MTVPPCAQREFSLLSCPVRLGWMWDHPGRSVQAEPGHSLGTEGSHWIISTAQLPPLLFMVLTLFGR